MSIDAMSTWRFPPPMNRPGMAGPWSLVWWLVMLAMWWVMMVAMMLPSATPMILLVAQVSRRARTSGKSGLSVGLLTTGYCLAWLGFSLAATSVQFVLERAGLVHGMLMWSLNPYLSAGLLAAAGLYQLTPLKQACLSNCRSPVSFLVERRRSGAAGALELGLTHGLYCVGCCWLLMALLFVGGIMNLVWIAGLAFIVLLEKLAPNPRPVSIGLGVMCLAAAAYILVANGLEPLSR
jgi:predicted metal-binding membrane protein